MSSSKSDEENAKKIDAYIQKDPGCKRNQTESVILEGNNEDLPVYRLPLDITFYNIKNGRFKMEYLDLVKKEGRELDSHDPKDAKKIQSLLVDLDPKESNNLRDDIQRFGQRKPGICTHDGFVINGNRRRAILSSLNDSGLSGFNYTDVCRLPHGVSDVDLWLIEAGIQLSKNVQLDYGPINTMLKFKEGFDAGLTVLQIAKNLYGGDEKKIQEKLEILRLIELYLDWLDEPEQYKNVERVHEHFLDLKSILDKSKKDGYNDEEQVALQNIGFQLIHDGVAQRELRKIKKMIAHNSIRKKLLTAEKCSMPEPKGEKRAKLEKAGEDGFTKAVSIFWQCDDELKATEESEQPIKLLNRALTNLENIDPTNSSLNDKDAIQALEKIVKIMEKLTK